ARGLVNGQRRTAVLWKIAAAVCVAAGLGLLTPALMRRASASEFADFAASPHVPYARGAMPLDIASSEPDSVSGWLQPRVRFAMQLPDYPGGSGAPKRYQLVGARLMQYHDQELAYLAYEMGGKPISLLMTSATAAEPAGGDIYRSGKLEFHFLDRNGSQLIAWTDHGIRYYLVSDLGGGADSCMICHGRQSDRKL